MFFVKDYDMVHALASDRTYDPGFARDFEAR